MSKLCIALPPFAPDYSGAASALFDMGGLIVIHDASGCTGNYTGFDEPRWFGSSAMVYCSALRHMDAVLGNDSKLINRVKEAAESLKPKFIAVLGSPVPMIIGTDFKGIAQEIEAVTGIPSIGIETTGLKYYGKGIYDATIELMKKFVKKKHETIPNSINIIGMTPLDFYINSNKEDFINLFEENGIKVNSCFYMGLTLESLAESVSASLNVVVSQAGIDVAKYMKTKYGIPYTVVTPIGTGEIALNQVKEALEENNKESAPSINGVSSTNSISSINGNLDRDETLHNTEDKNEPILIVGEQIISNSIRQYLKEICHHRSVTVATLFDVTKEYQAEGDITVKNELHLRKILKSGQYKTVIADPMIKKLIDTEDVTFHGFAHVALSSKVHWDECKRYLSEDMQNWLKSI